MNRIQSFLEQLIFSCRWVLAPMYLCLAAALFVITGKFGLEFWHILTHFSATNTQMLIISVLELVDIVLVGNLLIMIIFSGYENFVSKIEAAEAHVDRPTWMGKIDYSALKQKIIGSVVAISSIELLKLFIQLGNIETSTPEEMQFLKWKMLGMGLLHAVFVISGLLFALTEKSLHEEKIPNGGGVAHSK